MAEPTARPTNKVIGGALTGAVATIIVTIVEANGYRVDANLALAISTVLTFVISWLVPNSTPQEPPPAT